MMQLRSRAPGNGRSSGSNGFSTDVPPPPGKRQGALLPDKEQPKSKRDRPALGDLSNAISHVLIDSSKKPSDKDLKPVLMKRTSTRLSASNAAGDAQPPVLKKETNEPANGPRNARLTSLRSSSSAERAELSLEIAPSRKQGSTTTQQELPSDPCPEVDYDLENEGDQFAVAHYANDIFRYYRYREKFFRVGNYMLRQAFVTREMRAVLADWMVEVQENFELNHETLYLAVKLVDLYLDRTRDVAKDDLQLIASTAIFIASKFDERQPPLIDDFLYICEDSYGKEELIAMEMTMLKCVKFDLGSPLSYRFLRRYAKASKAEMATLTLARYVLETSLMFYEFVRVSDSLMAAACFLLALRMKKLGDWTPLLHKYSGYSLNEVEPLMWKLDHMLKMRPIVYEKLVTVHTKYSHEIFYSVAKEPLLTGGVPMSEPIGPPRSGGASSPTC